MGRIIVALVVSFFLGAFVGAMLMGIVSANRDNWED